MRKKFVGDIIEMSRKSDYIDVIMGAMAYQITSLTIVYSTVYSGADQRKHQSSASLAFVWGIHRWPANSPHKWPVTRKILLFDHIIMTHMRTYQFYNIYHNKNANRYTLEWIYSSIDKACLANVR